MASVTITASRGLGDAIYLRAVVLHLRARGERQVTVFTSWPSVFDDLPVIVRSPNEATGGEDWVFAKPCLHCRMPFARSMDIFSMCVAQAGITEQVPLRLGWTVRNKSLVDRVKAASMGRKVLVYQPLKWARNENQMLIQPHAGAFAELINARDEFKVRVGHGGFVNNAGTAKPDLDLFEETEVSDFLDVCTVADLFVTEVGCLVAIAQALEKPAICMFSRRAIESGRNYAGNIRPERIFHKPHLMTTVYDEPAWTA